MQLPQQPLASGEPSRPDEPIGFLDPMPSRAAGDSPRTITYDVGTQVRTPHNDVVIVFAIEDDVEWRTGDGGRVDPHAGARFCRLRVGYLDAMEPHGGGRLDDRFKVQLEDGTVIEPLDESYTSDRVGPRPATKMTSGMAVERTIYYELEYGDDPAYGIFDCTDERTRHGIWLRWRDPDRTEDLGQSVPSPADWMEGLVESMRGFLDTFPQPSDVSTTVRRILHLDR